MKLPESFGKVVGELPVRGRLPDGQEFPFGALRPVRDRFVERNVVKSSYAVYGEQGPWIAFAPIFQIAHSQMLKGVVSYLAEYFRVFAMDLRGNGRHPLNRRRRPPLDHGRCNFFVRSVDGRDFSARL